MTTVKESFVPLEKENKSSLEKIMLLFHLITQMISQWATDKTEAIIEKQIHKIEVYEVSPTISRDYLEESIRNESSILKKCEGERGILYLKESERPHFYPQYIVERTRILEIKDVTMKIRIYEKKMNHHIIYIENILGFLKELD